MKKVIQTNIVDCPGAEETGLVVWVQTEPDLISSQYYTVHEIQAGFYHEHEGNLSAYYNNKDLCIAEAIKDASKPFPKKEKQPNIFEALFLPGDFTAMELHVAESLERIGVNPKPAPHYSIGFYAGEWFDPSFGDPVREFKPYATGADAAYWDGVQWWHCPPEVMSSDPALKYVKDACIWCISKLKIEPNDKAITFFAEGRQTEYNTRNVTLIVDRDGEAGFWYFVVKEGDTTLAFRPGFREKKQATSAGDSWIKENL